jgi:Flp pilus assembly protein TadB
MKAQRISQLSADQVAAVFGSERFCQLTDGQLAALHHRAEQLQAQRHQARIRRRRRWAVAAAVVVVLAALAPVWHVLLALGVVALLWLVVLAWAWEAGQRLWASVTGRKGAAAGPQQGALSDPR